MGSMEIGQKMAHNKKDFSVNIVVSPDIEKIHLEKFMGNQPIGNRGKMRPQVIMHQLTNKNPKKTQIQEEHLIHNSWTSFMNFFSVCISLVSHLLQPHWPKKGNYLSALITTSQS